MTIGSNISALSGGFLLEVPVRYDPATRSVSGRALPNANVGITVDGSEVGVATADSKGVWNYTFNNAVAQGIKISAVYVSAVRLSSTSAPELSGQLIPAPVSILIDNFESLNDTAGNARTAQGNGQNGGVVALSLDSSKKIQASNAVRIAQTTAANATIGVNTTNAGIHDPASIDVFAAYYDHDTQSLISNQAINLTRGAQTISLSQGDAAYPGGDWIAGAVSEHANAANFIAQGAGTLAHSVRVSQNSPYGAATTVDALIKQAKGTPIHVYRYDDISQSQFDVAFQLHKKYNLPMSCNVPIDFIGQGGRWSKAMMDEAYASGLVEFNCDSTRNDSSANTTDTDADRAAALASLMANHDYLVANGYTRNEGHKHLIWANGTLTPRLAQHFQDNGFRFMVSTIPGINYVKHGVGKGRAKKMLSYSSVGTDTYDTTWKPNIARSRLIGALYSQHRHGVSDSGNDTRPAELEKDLQATRSDVDNGLALCLTYGQAWQFCGGFTTSLTLN